MTTPEDSAARETQWAVWTRASGAKRHTEKTMHCDARSVAEAVREHVYSDVRLSSIVVEKREVIVVQTTKCDATDFI